MSPNRHIALLLIGSLLSGCMVGPDYHPPAIDSPSEWGELSPPSETSQEDSTQAAMWWTVFKDPELNSLIDWAAAGNLDLRQAEQRVVQARALRTVASSALWPNVQSQASYARERQSANAPVQEGGQQFDLYQAGFDASWEIDVFGGNRRAVEAAEARVEAAQYNLAAVLVSLLGEVGGDYIDYRSLQERIAIARENVKSQQDTLALTRRLYAAGLTTDLDVARAESQVATTASTIPPLTTQAKQAMHRLGVLLGEQPMILADELATAAPIPQAPGVAEVGIPSDVLRQRPDVRFTERQLAAATADIGVATRDLYPRFFITGLAALESVSASEFFNWNSRALAIGPSITWTVFDDGLIRANILLRTAQQKEVLAAYRSVILQAFADVDDALVAYAQEQTRRDELVKAVAANQRAANLALQLYVQGLTDFLSVLQAQLNLFTSQDQLAQSRRDIALDLVALYKALGGGWQVS